MGLREKFSEMDTAVKILLALVLVPVVLVVALSSLSVVAALVGAFLLDLGPAAGTAAPVVGFDFQPNGDSVEVVHSGGDVVVADRLVVAVDGTARTWATLDADVDPGGTVRAGDSVTVTGVSSGSSIVVRWRLPDGGPPETLARYRVP